MSDDTRMKRRCSWLGLGLATTLTAGCSCQPRQGPDETPGGSTEADDVSGEVSSTDGAGTIDLPQRCPEKRIQERMLVQTDEELQALEGATYIQSLLIFRPVSTLEPLRCLEELDEELATGYYQSFPSLEPLRNLRRVPYLQLQSTQVDDMTPLRGLEAVDKLDVQFPKVTSLHGLESMRSGWVLVRKTGATDLRGLDNFRSGSLTLDTNDSLTSFDGLVALERLEYLGLIHNAGLTSLESLPSVSIDQFSFRHNDSLSSLAGLEHITSANVIELAHNPKLTSLRGLHNVTELWAVEGTPGYLHIEDNAIPNFDGLDSLRKVVGYIEIFNDLDDSLTSLDGLQQLEHVEANLSIVSNWQLTSLEPLRPDRGGSLMYVGYNLEIRANKSLPTCEAVALARAIRDAGGTVGGEFFEHNLLDECSA